MSAGPHVETFWTPERVERLTAMRAEGFSFGQIGGALGCTRNAAIGKAGRMGIPRHKRVVTSTSTVKRKRVTRVARNVNGHALKIVEIMETADPMELPPTEPVNPTKLLDLALGQCRWPCAGEGLETIFCGGEVVKGLSYCGGHCRLAYQKPGRRVSRAEFETEARKRRKVGLAA